MTLSFLFIIECQNDNTILRLWAYWSLVWLDTLTQIYLFFMVADMPQAKKHMYVISMINVCYLYDNHTWKLSLIQYLEIGSKNLIKT